MAARIFVFLACVYLLFGSREPPWADGRVMYETARSIVDRGSVALSPDLPRSWLLRHDGKDYGLYPLGTVLTMVPSYALYKLAIQVPGAPIGHLHILFSHLSATMAAAAACVVFFRLARREGARERTAALMAVALGTTTILAIYARVPYSEALQAALLTWVVHRAFIVVDAPTRGHGAVLGFAAGWLLNAKVANTLPLAVVGFFVLWQLRRDRPAVVRVVGGAAAAVAPWLIVLLAHNYVRTGNPLDTGYAAVVGLQSNFGGRLYDGLFGLLLSPGKGLFFFSPIVILGIIGFPAYLRARRPQALLIAGVALAVLAGHMKFHSWYGGWTWGPRYLVAIVPLLLVPAALWVPQALSLGWRRVRMAAVGALVAASLWVQVVGCAFFWDFYVRLILGMRPSGMDEHWAYVSTVFIPAMSPIVGHTWLFKHRILGDSNLDADPPFYNEAPSVKNLARFWDHVPLDFWFVDWLGPKGPRTLTAVLMVLFAAGALWAGVGIVRRCRRAPEGATGTS